MVKNYIKRSGRHEGVSLKEVVEQIVHDLAGPLSFLDLYVKELSSVKRSKHFSEEEIASSAKRSLEKVYSIIESLKDSAHELEPVFGNHDFAAVVRSVVSEMTAVASKRNVKICYSGPCHLVGKFDEEKVSRAVQNLIANAVDASVCGETVSVVIMHSGRSVWIEVADTGKGVPSELHDKIFDRGFSFGKELGSGLGLAYCKVVAEMHGGSVNVLSREGEGSSFTLSFPISAMLSASRSPILGDEKIHATILDEAEDLCAPWIASMLEKYSSVELVEFENSGDKHSDGEITLDPQ